MRHRELPWVPALGVHASIGNQRRSKCASFWISQMSRSKGDPGRPAVSFGGMILTQKSPTGLLRVAHSALRNGDAAQGLKAASPAFAICTS